MPEQITVGSIVEGKVVKIKDFGAIVSLGEGKQGLIHISEVANTFVKDINDYLKINDIVKVKILSVDEQTKRISLSIKAALPKPEHQNNTKPHETKQAFENKSRDSYNQSSNSSSDFEEKMKEFLRQSNEKQAGLNKRANKRQ